MGRRQLHDAVVSAALPASNHHRPTDDATHDDAGHHTAAVHATTVARYRTQWRRVVSDARRGRSRPRRRRTPAGSTVKPLPGLPGRDDEPDRTAELAFWSLVFIVLGTFLLAARPEGQGGWVIAVAVVSYAAAAWFLLLLLVKR